MGETTHVDPQRHHTPRRPAQREPAAGAGQPAHPLLGLQRTIGNAQVARLLAQRAMDDEEEELQAKLEVGAEGGTLSADVAGRVQRLRGGGTPLEPGLRDSLEAAMDTSFEDVRVHTGGEADALNRSMGARAFTSGSDVVLRSDQSPSDAHLIAHELTHVVQQRSMSTGGAEGMQVRPAGDVYEQAADRTAESLEREGLI